MASLPTIAATTLEDGFIELASTIIAKQQDPDKNPDNVSFFNSFNYNGVTGQVTFTCTVPVAQTLGAGGSIVLNTDEPYLD